MSMPEIDIRQIDLNLLVALEVLLREQSVTRAAEVMGRSQSTMSHTLARLREVFGDPLLVPGRGAMLPTPRALELREPLALALQQVRSLWEEEPSFSPATTQRCFSLSCVDALGALLPRLLAWLRAQAPGARLQVVPGGLREPAQALASGELDVALGRALEGGAQLRQSTVGRVRWLTFVRQGHTLLEQPLSLERWASAGCVQILTGTRSRSVVDMALEAAGLERRVGAHVPGFLLGLHAVAGSDLILTAPHVLAPLARGLGLCSLEPPLALPALPVALSWHERLQGDPAHRWFRQGLLERLRLAWEET